MSFRYENQARGDKVQEVDASKGEGNLPIQARCNLCLVVRLLISRLLMIDRWNAVEMLV